MDESAFHKNLGNPWIDIKKMVPEEGLKVILKTKGTKCGWEGNECIGFIKDREFMTKWNDDYITIKNVVAWKFINDENIKDFEIDGVLVEGMMRMV